MRLPATTPFDFVGVLLVDRESEAEGEEGEAWPEGDAELFLRAEATRRRL